MASLKEWFIPQIPPCDLPWLDSQLLSAYQMTRDLLHAQLLCFSESHEFLLRGLPTLTSYQWRESHDRMTKRNGTSCNKWGIRSLVKTVEAIDIMIQSSSWLYWASTWCEAFEGVTDCWPDSFLNSSIRSTGITIISCFQQSMAWSWKWRKNSICLSSFAKSPIYVLCTIKF